MDRAAPALVIAALLIVVFGLMLLGWRARTRRQGSLAEPLAVPSGLGPALLQVGVLSVATTLGDQPLERLTAHRLGFRARATVGVHAEGIVLAPTGRDAFLIPATALRGIGRATWTIDRVVERGGLVMIAWTLGETSVDTYLRVTDDDPAAAAVSLIAAIRTLVPASLTTSEGPAS
jgi:hypothetical protein